MRPSGPAGMADDASSVFQLLNEACLEGEVPLTVLSQQLGRCGRPWACCCPPGVGRDGLRLLRSPPGLPPSCSRRRRSARRRSCRRPTSPPLAPPSRPSLSPLHPTLSLGAYRGLGRDNAIAKYSLHVLDALPRIHGAATSAGDQLAEKLATHSLLLQCLADANALQQLHASVLRCELGGRWCEVAPV